MRRACLLAALLVLGCAARGSRVAHGPAAPPAPVAPPARPTPPPPAPMPRPVPLKPPPGCAGLDTRVSAAAKEVSLRELLFSLARQAGVNLVMDEDVEDRRVTVNLQGVPLWRALRLILGAQGLYFRVEEGCVRVRRMVTRFFHIDYVVSSRRGTTTTQVTLRSASDQGSSKGDVSLTTSALVDFWKNLEARLQEIMADPLQRLLEAAYVRESTRRDLQELAFEAKYQRMLYEQQLKLGELQRRVLAKQLESGVIPQQLLTPASPEVPRAGRAERGTEGREAGKRPPIVGTYAIDPQSGTVVVTTTPEVMERVERFIRELKANIHRQVFIDVQILEVALSRRQELGIDWSAFPGFIQFFRLPGLRSAIRSSMQAAGAGSGGGTTGQGITSPLPSSPFSFSPSGDLQVGVLKPLSGSMALQYSIEALISFLKTQGEVRAISRPQLLTLNNQPAVVSVGTNDFYVTYEQVTTATGAGGISTTAVTSKLNPLFIGVSLSITPQIGQDGEITLQILPVINRKVGEKVVPTGISSAPTQSIPLTETRQASTVVRTRDGQPVVISGLIQEGRSERERKVPLLGDLPGIGGAFRYRRIARERSELVIVITPHLQPLEGPRRDLGYEELSGCIGPSTGCGRTPLS